MGAVGADDCNRDFRPTTDRAPHNPMVYERPLGLCMGSVRGEPTDHSYQTFLAFESLQKLTSTRSPHFTSMGSWGRTVQIGSADRAGKCGTAMTEK